MPPPQPAAAGFPDTDDVLVGSALDAVSVAAGLALPPAPPPLHPTPPDHGFTARSFDLRVGERPSTEVAIMEAERSADALARSMEAVARSRSGVRPTAGAGAGAWAAKAGGGAPLPLQHRRASRAAYSDDGSAGGNGLGGTSRRSTEDGGGGGATPRSAGGGGRSGRRKPRGPAPGPRGPAIPPHVHAQASFLAMGLKGLISYIRSYGVVGAAADPADAPGPGVRRCAKTAHARLRACLRDGVLVANGLPPGPHPVIRKRDRSGDGGRGVSRAPSEGWAGGGGGGGGTPLTAPPAPNLAGSRRSSRGLVVREGMDVAPPYDDRQRFLLDLEFVQALACPHYVLHLSQAGYLADPAFLGYLRHLEYWRAPGYAAFLQYPAGLAILDLLRSASARAALSRPDVADWVHAQQFFQWSKYWANRAADA